MRSDFYSLPYAARRVIRRGEHAEQVARARAYSIAELEAKVAELEKALAAANATIASLTPNSDRKEKGDG